MFVYEWPVNVLRKFGKYLSVETDRYFRYSKVGISLNKMYISVIISVKLNIMLVNEKKMKNYQRIVFLYVAPEFSKKVGRDLSVGA